MEHTPHQAVRIGASAAQLDVLVAALSVLGFEGFEERDSNVVAYIPSRLWTTELEEAVARVAGNLKATVQSVERIEPRNWNADWEKTITPIVVPPFEIIPPWEAGGEADMTIVIEPKMSFGTGHHETTRLILGMLADTVEPGWSVLDAGTGTGVLALAALRLGASKVSGFDIDPWSIENARENAERNGLSDRLLLREGDLSGEPTGTFDLILANINRNALLGMLPGYYDRLSAGGTLILSGLLRTDQAHMEAEVQALGFSVNSIVSEGEWIAIKATK